MVLESQVDQVAATADPLQDVLDVVTERGDGLAHRGQPFGVDQCRLGPLAVDHQRGLVPDRHQQPQRLFAEPLAGAATLEDLVGSGGGVEVDGTEYGLPTHQGRTDRLADPGLQDAATAREPLVLLSVGGADAAAVRDNQVDDAPRDRHRRTSRSLPSTGAR